MADKITYKFNWFNIHKLQQNWLDADDTESYYQTKNFGQYPYDKKERMFFRPTEETYKDYDSVIEDIKGNKPGSLYIVMTKTITVPDKVNQIPLRRLNNYMSKRPFKLAIGTLYNILEESVGGPFTWNIIESYCEQAGSIETWINRLGFDKEHYVTIYLYGEEKVRLEAKYMYFKRIYNDTSGMWSMFWTGNNERMKILGEAEKQHWTWLSTDKDGKYRLQKMREWWTGKELNDFNMLRFMWRCREIIQDGLLFQGQ